MRRLKGKLEQSTEKMRQATETCMRCLTDLDDVRNQMNQRSKLYSATPKPTNSLNSTTALRYSTTGSTYVVKSTTKEKII